MKRPLCLMAILLTAAVFIYLELFLSDITGKASEDLDGSSITVVGTVQGKEFRKNFQGEILPVLYLLPNDQDVSEYSLIQCYLDSSDPLPAIGEYAEVAGKVKIFSPPTNPGEFDSRLYYSSLKISYRITGCRVLRTGGRASPYREGLFKVRMFLEAALDRTLNEEDSAIMKAMLLGDKAYMDSQIKDMYKDSGIIHILAVSGLHISIIGMGVYELLRRLYLWSAKRLDKCMPEVMGVMPAVVAIGFMYSYGIMCGMGTSSFRAICMFVLRLLAPILGRTYDVLSALALAAIFLLLDQPLYLYNSGFLFSFGAVLGITVIKPLLVPYRELCGLEDEKMKFAEEKDEQKGAELLGRFVEALHKLKDGFVNSLAVVITTLPVYACFYYTYPLHSLLLNLVVIPVMGVLMLLGIACLLTGSIGWTMGTGVVVHFILAFYKWLCSGSALRSGFTWYMGHADKWQVGLYIALILAFVCLPKVMRKWVDLSRGVLLAVAFFVLTFHPSPELEINMIDVGQGDGVMVSFSDRHMLIDGGSTSKNSVGKYQIIPFLKYKGVGRLEAVVLTHEDKDHMSGILELMDDMEKGGIRIGQLILPEVAESSRGESYHLLEQRARELGIPTVYINTGESFSLGKASFTCLNPQPGMVTDGANAYSTVLLMKYGEFSALFTGDVEKEGLENVNRVLRKWRNGAEGCESPTDSVLPKEITLLKVAHHGSQYTTDQEFLELTRPRIALISCGRDNSYGHPHQELLDRLDAFGIKVYRTDESGELEITLKHGRLQIKEFLN